MTSISGGSAGATYAVDDKVIYSVAFMMRPTCLCALPTRVVGSVAALPYISWFILLMQSQSDSPGIGGSIFVGNSATMLSTDVSFTVVLELFRKII